MDGRVVIIGYGNPLRTDDGLGWHAAIYLRGRLKCLNCQIFAVHQLTPELSETLANAMLVIFIDASHEGQPGTWKLTVIGRSAVSYFAHHFTPAGLLDYTRVLFGASPSALLLSVAGESFDCGETLTPRIQALLPEVLRQTRAKIKATVSEKTPA